jgi:hypothetical protein
MLLGKNGKMYGENLDLILWMGGWLFFPLALIIHRGQYFQMFKHAAAFLYISFFFTECLIYALNMMNLLFFIIGFAASIVVYFALFKSKVEDDSLHC